MNRIVILFILHLVSITCRRHGKMDGYLCIQAFTPVNWHPLQSCWRREQTDGDAADLQSALIKLLRSHTNFVRRNCNIHCVISVTVLFYGTKGAPAELQQASTDQMLLFNQVCSSALFSLPSWLFLCVYFFIVLYDVLQIDAVCSLYLSADLKFWVSALWFVPAHLKRKINANYKFIGTTNLL